MPRPNLHPVHDSVTSRAHITYRRTDKNAALWSGRSVARWKINTVQQRLSRVKINIATKVSFYWYRRARTPQVVIIKRFNSSRSGRNNARPGMWRRLRLLFIQWLRYGPKRGHRKELLPSERFYCVCFVIRHALRGVILSVKISNDGQWPRTMALRVTACVLGIRRTTIEINNRFAHKYKIILYIF